MIVIVTASALCLGTFSVAKTYEVDVADESIF